jgi:hypothetical protein
LIFLCLKRLSHFIVLTRITAAVDIGYERTFDRRERVGAVRARFEDLARVPPESRVSLSKRSSRGSYSLLRANEHNSQGSVLSNRSNMLRRRACTLQYRVIEPVARGDALTFNYLGELACRSIDARNELLQLTKRFNCQCSMCREADRLRALPCASKSRQCAGVMLCEPPRLARASGGDSVNGGGGGGTADDRSASSDSSLDLRSSGYRKLQPQQQPANRTWRCVECGECFASASLTRLLERERTVEAFVAKVALADELNRPLLPQSLADYARHRTVVFVVSQLRDELTTVIPIGARRRVLAGATGARCSCDCSICVRCCSRQQQRQRRRRHRVRAWRRRR